jgi:hypothetical protein
MGRIMVDGLLGHFHPDSGSDRLSRTQIAAPARMRTTGDLQAKPVPAPEPVSCRPHIDLNPQGTIWLSLSSTRFYTKETIANVGGTSVGGNVAQAAKEIGTA